MAVGAVNTTEAYFETRFAPDPRRAVLWQSLCRFYFRRLISPNDAVVDLGCGYGDFINSVTAKRRVAVDKWEGAARHLATGVEHFAGAVTNLSFLGDDSIDVAFASNLFEHLTQDEFRATLGEIRRVLRMNGKLILVQPNYRYAHKEYFDDYTHVSVYSHVSMMDFLTANGFSIERCVPRFMPFSLKSRVRVSPMLVWAYLHSPIKPFGKQMLIVATPASR